jgi:putative flavoprotein involved in K+ transport
MNTTSSSPTSTTRPVDALPERVTTVIIGAGQAGLATAYHLQRAGQRVVVLERHARVGDQWRRRYTSLVLNTPAKYDSLPGLRFPAPPSSFPTAGELADYLEQYARHHRLHLHCGVAVTSVEQSDDGAWIGRTDEGTVYRSENVVVATGGDTHPRVPDVADRIDPGIRQLHSSEYRDPSSLLPGPTLVVGLGQSGADIAIELRRTGREVWLSGTARAEVPIDIASLKGRIAFPFLWFAWNHVLTERTGAGRKTKAGIRSGSRNAPLLRVKRADLDAAGVHRTDERTTDVVGGKPALADGTVLDVTNVVWCTGYRQDFSFIHPSPVGDDGWPRDVGGVMDDLPGLYFMGLLFQRGFYSMLVGGAGRDGRHIAGQILRRSGVNSPTAA